MLLANTQTIEYSNIPLSVTFYQYQCIQVFRYDQKLKTLYIQAGLKDEIAVIIDQDGKSN
ncbi:DUF6888 family protein [Nostoc sp.]|uniref:DUF6888 family protein n=1 Tax=Nostoc sp. TaxID=1180 RepID=UPI002FF5B1DD